MRASEEKGFFPLFSGFPRLCSSKPPEKGKKGRKRAKTADLGRFPGRAARHPLNPPRGPKDQKNSRFRARLKISSENEIFERATHCSPFFVCGEIETSRLKISSEILNFFDRWALWAHLLHPDLRQPNVCVIGVNACSEFARNLEEF